MSIRLPDFLLIGEMKCGTTTLWDLLTQDERIFAPREKELHFFSSYSFFGASGLRWPGNIAGYASNFVGVAENQKIGEATPNYLFDPLACRRIREVIPDVRLVVILRDPVDRAWSHYWHEVDRGVEDLSFEEALKAEPERLNRDYDSRQRYSYVARGRYIENLQRFEQTFSREQLCVVFLDDLRRDLVGTICRVWQHLGLEPPVLANPTLPHRNRASFPRWPRLDRFTRSAMSWAKQCRGSVLTGARLLSRFSRPLRTYSGAPHMRQEDRWRLEKALRDSNRAFYEWLGQPVPWRI